MSESDLHFFKLARECSLQSDYCGNAHIGCVIVYKHAVLAKGFNTDKTHTIQSKYNVVRYKDCGNKYLPSKVHAELSALQKIKYLDIDFSKVKVYVYRELKDGSIAMARPCPSCVSAIKAMGIKVVKYTTPDGYATERLI